MRSFIDRLDIALSYTDAVLSDVQSVKANLADCAVVYDYRDWLNQQAGASIAKLAESIYVAMPCIVFAARDWFERPATVLESQLLSHNRQPKLVFDYSGEFETRERSLGIANIVYGRFVDDVFPDADQAVKFVYDCFPSIGPIARARNRKWSGARKAQS